MENTKHKICLPEKKGNIFSSEIVNSLKTLTNNKEGIERRGAVFTRTEVVEFILDMVGYTDDQPLHKMKLLEPSFGEGDFLLPVIERLLKAWNTPPKKDTKFSALKEIGDSIRAVELHSDTYNHTRKLVIERLIIKGVSEKSAIAIVNRWLIQDDFLLVPLQSRLNFVVGNPPYVRQESIDDALLLAYRQRYKTMYDRADLYIPFYERSLSLLSENGSLGFICADRWMKNRYGGPLRNLISKKYHLKAYVDMANTSAFHSEVNAYPAITIISHKKYAKTRIAHNPPIDKVSLHKLAKKLTAKKLKSDNRNGVLELDSITNGMEPWLLDSPDQTAIVRRLEQDFPTLEEASCKVGIGVATGADNAFIGNFGELDVEEGRKLPLVGTHDIKSGEVNWLGKGVINPFDNDGKLVDLVSFPRLQRYLEERRDVIARRHVAQKAPNRWYKTIDRIYPHIANTPKLLIPDIKGRANVVYERGEFYPHHNLYYITSETWELRALQALLLSEIARLFVATYSTKMRGGYLRFQAQYLRRIRIPYWNDVSDVLRTVLTEAAINRDFETCNRAAFELYGLNDEERAALGGNGV